MDITTPNEAREIMGAPNTITTKSMADIVVDNEDDSRYGPNGGFTAVLSTPRLDRDGDIWPQDEWIQPLPGRITVDADHGMSVATTIGSAVPYFDNEGRLLIDASFSSIPRAQEVRTLIREKHISSVSVAAMTDKSKKSGDQRRELLNAGVVAIPSNPDAMILDAKNWHDKKSLLDALVTAVADLKATSSSSGQGGDVALTQAIHDASIHLGASCPDCAQCAAQAFSEANDHEDPTGSAEGANSKSATPDEDITIETPETKAAEADVIESPAAEAPVADAPTVGLQQAEFFTMLEQFMTTFNPPAVEPEAPADEAAAAVEETPAPAEEAAVEEEAAEETVDPNKRAIHMLMVSQAINSTLEKE